VNVSQLKLRSEKFDDDDDDDDDDDNNNNNNNNRNLETSALYSRSLLQNLVPLTAEGE
jgi:hypothetical protein